MRDFLCGIPVLPCGPRGYLPFSGLLRDLRALRGKSFP